MEGVLGLSWAFSLPLHDVVSGTAVDYMHCICEGAIDQHLNAWFEDKSGNQYLGNSVSEVDNALLSIKPISEITRRPRSLLDWKQWKGMYTWQFACINACTMYLCVTYTFIINKILFKYTNFT